MKSKSNLQLPQALSNLPIAIAISAVVGYGILDFENLFPKLAPAGSGYIYSLQSFFKIVSLNKYIPLLLLYLIQFSLYGILLISLAKRVYTSNVKRSSKQIGFAITLILAVIFWKTTVTTNALPQLEINNLNTKISILVYMGMFVSTCIGTLLFIQLKILDGGIKEVNVFLKDKAHYFKVRRDINSLIFLFGVIISLATLATSAIQKIAGDEIIPKHAVYYYGILGSVLMCAIYLPLHLKYKTLGYYLIEEFGREKGIKKETIEYIEFYKKMEDDLNLNVSVKDNIMDAIPILAPATAAIINGF